MRISLNRDRIGIGNLAYTRIVIEHTGASWTAEFEAAPSAVPMLRAPTAEWLFAAIGKHLAEFEAQAKRSKPQPIEPTNPEAKPAERMRMVSRRAMAMQRREMRELSEAEERARNRAAREGACPANPIELSTGGLGDGESRW